MSGREAHSDCVWVPIESAALRLGLSHEDVVGQVRDGRLVASLEDRGWFVEIPTSLLQQSPPHDSVHPSRVNIRDLSEQIGALQSELVALRHDETEASLQLSELGLLMRRTQQQLEDLPAQIQSMLTGSLPHPSQVALLPDQGVGWSGPQTRSRWQSAREGKKGLGASLTLTGILAIAAGIVLHIGLQTHTLDSSVHLGYTIGLIGLFSLLIGLVLVF